MHVVRTPPAPILVADGALEVLAIPAAADNLVWLVTCTRTGEAVVVDGPGAGELLEVVDASPRRLVGVLNTHTHHDHIGVNKDLARRGRLSGLRVEGPARRAADVPGLTRGVDDGDEVRVGEVVGRVWRTEGHMDGHVSFVFPGAVFCGDTLFTGGCGFLFDGPPAVMFASLLRLASLPGDTLVCCAHEYTQDNLRFAWSVEPDNEALAARIEATWAARAAGRTVVPSTVELERATNPFLRPGSPTLRAHVATAMGLPDGATHGEVFAATRALKNVGAYKARGDEGLPLAGPATG